MKVVNFNDLLGKTFTNIEVNKEKDEIDFYLENGDRYSMFHSQDCCESVSIEDIEGDFSDLIGNPITLAEEVSNSELFEGRPKNPDSFTWTFYKLATIKGYVTMRWLGESNGYYSESVDLYFETQTEQTIKSLKGQIVHHVSFDEYRREINLVIGNHTLTLPIPE